MSARIAASIAGSLALLATWFWLGERSAPQRSQASESSQLVPGAYYAIDSSGPTISFDLPAQSGTSCELLVSSLGSSEETYVVRLNAEPIAQQNLARHVEVVPLLWKRSTRSDAGLNSEHSSPRTSVAGAPLATESHHSRRYFHLHVTDSELENPQAYTRVAARCLKEGKGVRIYGDEQVSDAEWNPGVVNEIVRLLDEQIIPRSRELLGLHHDVDGDGKLAILMTPWLGRLQGGRTSVNGFVRSADFRKGGKPPFSNRADLIYLNAGLSADDGLSALLAHEYTHAVCFSARHVPGEGASPRLDEEDWLSEAIAHVAERTHGAGWANLDERLAAFLATPERSPLVVRDYYRAGLWRDHGCRGATFLFLTWIVGECGDGLLRDLVAHPHTGEKKLTALTGHSLAELLRHWAIALHRGEPGGLDLYGSVGRHELNGLRRSEWSNLEEPHTVEMKGTAITCIRLHPQSARRIVITPSSGARLQVTLNLPESGRSRSSGRKNSATENTEITEKVSESVARIRK